MTGGPSWNFTAPLSWCNYFGSGVNVLYYSQAAPLPVITVETDLKPIPRSTQVVIKVLAKPSADGHPIVSVTYSGLVMSPTGAPDEYSITVDSTHYPNESGVTFFATDDLGNVGQLYAPLDTAP
jgi:hypothetical protein